ncbi:MAG: choice-of-anchor B family protein [Candidatus Marinimicrobia bacterium]|nr:choice-of-anchor B family protein [Candidatus Neomarinimicrobiota bacterium]
MLNRLLRAPVYLLSLILSALPIPGKAAPAPDRPAYAGPGISRETRADSLTDSVRAVPVSNSVPATLTPSGKGIVPGSSAQFASGNHGVASVDIARMPSGRSEQMATAPANHAQYIDSLGVWNGRNPTNWNLNYGDIWGYTAPDGSEYALLNVRSEGLSIINIDGNVPVEVGFAAAIFTSGVGFPDSKDVKVYGQYAYLVNQYAPVQVIDLSDVTAPYTVDSLHIGGSGSNLGGAHNAYIEGPYLYVTGGEGPLGQGVSIFDLTDPSRPVALGGFHEIYYHDIFVRNDTAFAAATTSGVDVLDLTVKSSPVRIHTFGYDGNWVHNTATSEDGNFLFVGDENGTNGRWTRVFDVSDVTNPVMVAEIIVDPNGTTHNSYVLGAYLYIAHYKKGLRVIDISDESNPIEVAFYDTYPGGGDRFNGAWSVYPYFASGKLIVSDLISGLFVLKLSETLQIRDDQKSVPDEFYLAQNHPNPFNATTTLEFGLPGDDVVTLTVHDLLGREVSRLDLGWHNAGRHSVTWDAGELPSGIYFARLTTKAGYSKSVKITMLK